MKHFIPFKHLATLVMLLVAATAVFASPRSVEEARQAALQQMRKSGPNKVKGQGLIDGPQLVYSKAGKKVTADYYVFSAGKNLGYTIVSGDDRLPAIVGYTDNGDFDATRLPENLAAFMQAYVNFVETATDEQINEVAAWKAKAPSHSAVAPLMAEKWNQSDPYNGMCPDFQGHKCVTGCVATASAQILHYHYAKNGYQSSLLVDIPEYNYTLNDTPITIPGIPAGATYDWANMQNEYNGSETQEQKDAVAKLMLHVGCAAKMLYTPSSSGAVVTSSLFTTYFGMDEELTRQIFLCDYTLPEWDDILYKEIAEARPVLYSGQSAEGNGHTFVIHGYNEGLYYVNWGWGGYCDGYFDITILNPDEGGIGAGSIGEGYNIDNSMVIGIQKDNGVVDDVLSAVFSSYAYSIDEISISGNKIKATAKISPWNCTDKNQTRYVSVGIKENNGNITNVGKPYEVKDMPPTYLVNDVPCPIEFDCQEGGVYYLYMIESKDNSTWIPCNKGRLQGGIIVPNVITLRVVDGKVVIGDKVIETKPQLSATVELDTEKSDGYAETVNIIKVTVTNSGDGDYNNMIDVFCQEKLSLGSVYTENVSVPANSNTTFDFKFTPSSAGDYIFIINDNEGKEIGKSIISFAEKEPEKPVISLLSIKCANASDEKIYAQYFNNLVEMNVVKDTKADFEFKLKNDGGDYIGEVMMMYNNPNTNEGGLVYKNVKLLKGETTTLTCTVEGAVGSTMQCFIDFDVDGFNGVFNKLPKSDEIIHNIKDGGYCHFDSSEICYLAGNGDGINDSVVDTENTGAYYNLKGQRVLAPAKGIYIKNGKKYVVK